jgi:hypothetical protein
MYFLLQIFIECHTVFDTIFLRAFVNVPLCCEGAALPATPFDIGQTVMPKGF